MELVYTTSLGKNVTLETRLGGGGEGEVWTVQGSLEVAKIYHPQVIKPEHEQKLRAMVANPPMDEMRVKGHISIAWPTELLFRGKKFAGFLMPRLDKSPTIFTIYHPLKRQKECPGFNWHYLLHTATNLSKAIEAIHHKDYVIGDLNESNILVKPTALVSVIDTDSFQVTDTHGKVYRCKVGKEEFTPPELVGKPLDQIDRLPEHDNFGLGVLIFRLLMEGFYPFAGVLKIPLNTSEPEQFYCLKAGAFPYVKNHIVKPPPFAPKFEILPPEVQKLMVRCFVDGYKNPKSRPSPSDWIPILETAGKSLIICKSNKEHHYSRHLAKCPWCEREATKPKIGLQTPLPPAKVRPSSQPTPVHGASAPTSPPTYYPVTPTAPPSAVYPQSTPRHRRSERMWEKVKQFFYSPKGYLDWSIWSREIRKYILLGGIGGVGGFFLLILMLMYPMIAGYAVGAITAVLIVIPTCFIARYWFRLQTVNGRGIGIVTILLAAGLVMALILRMADLVGMVLAALQPHMGWLSLDCLLIGVIGGISYGNYRTLSRRKSKAIASFTSMALALIPLLLIGKMGLFSMPFRYIQNPQANTTESPTEIINIQATDTPYTVQASSIDTTFAKARLIAIGIYGEDQAMLTIETYVQVTGDYRATVNGKPFTCRTPKEFPTSLDCIGSKIVPDTMCEVLVYPLNGSDLLFASNIAMPP